jgi:formylmethanofuran dehydrogenase subunit E
MNCERCGKRLSRKTARQIEGEVMCSTCMFAGRKAKGKSE